MEGSEEGTRVELKERRAKNKYDKPGESERLGSGRELDEVGEGGSWCVLERSAS